jgi:hypothetical protein
VALRAVAHDGDFFAFDERKVTVFVVINFHFYSLIAVLKIIFAY